MLIREVKIEDADILINLIKNVEAHSNFMLMEPEERKTTPRQMQKQIEDLASRDNSTIFVAEKEGVLAGYQIVIGGTAKRVKHSAYIVIGISDQNRGQGIGTALFQRTEQWAKSRHISRLELTVVTENKAGVALYKNSGFEIEGIKRNSLLIEGTFFDEYYMAKLL